jgi:hypothetical protein
MFATANNSTATKSELEAAAAAASIVKGKADAPTKHGRGVERAGQVGCKRVQVNDKRWLHERNNCCGTARAQEKS